MKHRENFYQKIFCLNLIFVLFFSCGGEKKDNKNFKSLAFLILQSDTNEDSSEVFTNERRPPEVEPVENLDIKDPLYNKQWYLKNTGQYGGKAGIDINIEPVWKRGYLGKNMFVAILDNPVQESHPDLKDNISNVKDYYHDIPLCDPNGDEKKNRYHGTEIAGLIVARDNDFGIRGVAPRANLYSYGVMKEKLSNNKSSLYETISLALKESEYQKIAAYNGSLGPAVAEGYVPIQESLYQSVEQVIQKGFYGKGSSLVFAAGNSSIFKVSNSSSESWLANHYAVMAINSITNGGKRKEQIGGIGGVNLWLVAPSVVEKTFDSRMYTTNLICEKNAKEYSPAMSATSGATPLVTGVIILLRQAYPNLTWRDVKLILAESAKKVTGGGQVYQKTGRMYSDSSQEQKYGRYTGFGLVDADAAFKIAESWKLLPPMKTFSWKQIIAFDVQTKDRFHESSLFVDSNEIKFIESVTLEMEVTKTKEEISVDQWDLVLIAPDGTESSFFKANRKKALSHRYEDAFSIDKNHITLISNSFLGSSNVYGNWRLKIRQYTRFSDEPDQNSYFTEIKNWKLTIRGH